MAYDELTVVELKDMLRERGLPVSGRKSELVARLTDADEAPSEAEQEEAPLENAPDIIDEGDDFEEDDDDYFEEEGDFEEWDDFHTSRQKPVLDDATRAALDMRAAQSKKQPAFRRQEWFRYRRLSKTGYRKPKGKDSKMRQNRKYRAPMARVGYGKVAAARGLHPSGFAEVLVHNSNELDGLDPELQAVRIGAGVGNRKRSRIHDRADDLGLRVLNRRPIDRKGDLQ
uniref:Large ribosomal subunit protein eL32 n=1 Tax=uncultured marine group II euryarchaeote KM3-85-F5 TaxID=526684 RepID=B3V5H9_9ARCH|nr:ribosomal protein L32 [uncultured marine group II euryarchaeote KM3-85-F5]